MHERNGKHPISLNFKCHESNSLSKLYFSFDSGWLEREVARKLVLGKKLAVSAESGGVCVFPVAQGK